MSHGPIVPGPASAPHQPTECPPLFPCQEGPPPPCGRLPQCHPPPMASWPARMPSSSSRSRSVPSGRATRSNHCVMVWGLIGVGDVVQKGHPAIIFRPFYPSPVLPIFPMRIYTFKVDEKSSSVFFSAQSVGQEVSNSPPGSACPRRRFPTTFPAKRYVWGGTPSR